MKYVDEYRDHAVAQKLVAEIKRAVTRPWVIMEVLRRTDPFHREIRARLFASQGSGTGARAGLSGLRDASGYDRSRAFHCAPSWRHFLLVWRHASRARFSGRSLPGESRGWGCPDRLFTARLPAHRQSQSR